MKSCLKQTCLLLLCMCAQLLSAQDAATLSGTVVDEDQVPLAGVSVLEVGTANGVVTDFDGQFTLKVSAKDAQLQFSYIGFKTQTIGVRNAKSPMQITMEADVVTLEGVVVTSLGFTESKDELGYASSTVKGAAVAQSGEATLLNGLSGKSSGVRISRNSGDPGAGSFIQIRGLSSITRDSQPLIVVDGVPISNDTRGNSSSSGVSQQSRLNDLNPNDIENISVLKGASAAALWGTQALGGVIVITTKSGKFNKKLSVSLQSTYSLDQINRKYPLQTKFGQGDNGVFNQRARDSYGDLIADRSGAADDFNTNGEFYVGQNGVVYYPILQKNSRQIYDDSNFDQVFHNGHFFENNLSLSSGGQNTTVFFSLSDLNQQGIIRNNSDYRRSTARLNVKHNFTDWLNFKFNTTYAHTDSNRIRKGSSSSGLYLGLLRTPADFDISGYRGDYYANSSAAPVTNRHRSYLEPLGADDSPTYNNPLWTINEQQDLARVDRFISNFELTASPKDWLDLIARVGVDHYSEHNTQFFTPGSAAGAFRLGLLDLSLATNTIFNMDYIAKGNFNLSEDFKADALVGFNYNAKSRLVNGTEATNFIQFVDVASGIRDIDNSLPENITPTASQGRERTAAVYSSLSLDAFDMFFLNGTLRVESASTFGSSENNTFMFPSTSLAWQFSKLWDADNGLLSFGKLRASYGEVGVQPARYNTSNTFVSPSYGDALGGSLNLGLYGNGGFVPSASRGNSSLKPERKKELELGTDLRFFNNRLSLSATWFTNTTEDVLLDFPVANSTGYASIYSNGAEIQNDGFELDLGYRLLTVGDFNWQVNANFTKVKNEVTDLSGIESLDLGGLSAVSSRAVEGYPIGVLWGSKALRDDNNELVLDSYGFPVLDPVEGVIGDPNPDWQGGLTNTLSYKGFSLSVLFETFQGADIYAGTKAVLKDLGRWYDTANVITADRNYFEANGNVINIGQTFRGNVQDFGGGPVALTERWYNSRGGFFSGGIDELYIEDGSWSRIREINLSYNYSSEWLKRATAIESVQFSVTGRNLFLWSKFEGNDPDTNLSGVSAARGIDYFNNPGTKSYLFNLTLNL